MFQSFRMSMTWLHTWFGLVIGYVLMVCFFFGALSVFDREIDRWAIPETRFEPQVLPSFDKMLLPIFEKMEPLEEELDAARDRVGGPLPESKPVMGYSAYTTHRDPVLMMFSEYAITNNPDDPRDHVHGYITIDPRSGAQLSDEQLKIGSEFFYPLHYSLHLHWANLGYWIVGFAALVMLAALVSGVVMHRKIFREFFTFRPNKQAQRSALDLHNLTGVVALPFHFFFALTGLIVFASIYLPVGETMFEDVALKQAQEEAAATGLAFDPAGVPAPLASVDAMVVEAKRRWAARDMTGEVGFLAVNHIGDANSYVSIYRAGTDRVTLTGQGIHFKGSTGEIIREDPPPSAVEGVTDFMTGLHLQHFKHWMLRWLYVLGGLAGCVCIATGFIFFVEKRKRAHAKSGSSGARWADAVAVSTVTGIVIAAAGMLVGNRLLPTDLPDRGFWEESVFWLSWLAAFVHAAIRSAPVQQARISPAWREQCWAIAVLAVGAVVLNWITTGDHLLKTLGEAYWPVAGFDLALLAAAALAVFAARRLRLREIGAIEQRETSSGGAEAAHA
ncbi:putative iron-regulated membrane protein [Povalibacter uvarum]|uniref:Putative iron-regulated membrane protein n=1 Tax=Povalibacter uvarum TaxID=732238 RepID=A0A841HHB2_9GAMM|nr:PepSY-associated TM helix domain-containing protein [Povalibacter uvarum]MBB6092541.1 putative iron-regulated membrane protein [Povalibacter uvarum]